MNAQQQLFGGDWTQEKLRRVAAYLKAYQTALKNKPFDKAYIDAFAGTGLVRRRGGDSADMILLPELAEQEARDYIVGSARQALEVDPPFARYVFIERSQTAASELEELRTASPLADRVTVKRGDANESVSAICQSWDWYANRAVAFLDPFGMQVEWPTVQAIAKTQAIDLWYLFPLGAAMRLLTRDGEPEPALASRLDRVFGCQDWHDAFYKASRQASLLGEDVCVQRTASFSDVVRFTLDRLRGEFAGVADKGLVLCNSKNVPLFLLCFAVGNERGKPIALRIANHILKD